MKEPRQGRHHVIPLHVVVMVEDVPDGAPSLNRLHHIGREVLGEDIARTARLDAGDADHGHISAGAQGEGYYFTLCSYFTIAEVTFTVFDYHVSIGSGMEVFPFVAHHSNHNSIAIGLRYLDGKRRSRHTTRLDICHRHCSTSEQYYKRK